MCICLGVGGGGAREIGVGSARGMHAMGGLNTGYQDRREFKPLPQARNGEVANR